MPHPKLTLVAGGARIDERDDDALMLLAAAGRSDAFALLVRRHGARLANLCAKLLCDRLVGEEVAQESWLQVWSARGKYQPGGQFPVYLFTVARNRCRNQLRDRQRRGRWVGLEPGPDEAPDRDAADHLDALIERERRRRVNEAIATLPPALREVLLFRFSEGLDYADIARIVGRTESGVRSRVYLAMERLRAQLSRKVEP
jgi:RNA polymerase sigma-70 factor (ECF subfamily)